MPRGAYPLGPKWGSGCSVRSFVQQWVVVWPAFFITSQKGLPKPHHQPTRKQPLSPPAAAAVADIAVLPAAAGVADIAQPASEVVARLQALDEEGNNEDDNLEEDLGEEDLGDGAEERGYFRMFFLRRFGGFRENFI